MGVAAISIPPSLAYVLNAAGDKSGVDFDYLLTTAMRESALKPDAKAATSSAVGLFQFLEQTWFDVMKSDGARLGYKAYADAIQVNASGRYSVADPKLRADILALREEPQVAADLAAAFTKRNGDYLSERFGRMPSPGELYIAHFLGAKGAEKLFEAGLADSSQIAAKLFPEQAAANRGIFYANGRARTIKQVYQALVAKHETAPRTDAAFAAQQLAQDKSLPLPQSGPLVRGQADMSFVSLFAPVAPASGASAPVDGGQSSGFFVQLYAK